jgi:membrane protein implicated in regulation of membrane protease activity
MKKDIFAVYATSLFLLVYAFTAFSELNYQLVMAMFTISPIWIIWMVYRVLKSPDEPTRTFTDYFYMDVDIKPTKTKND